MVRESRRRGEGGEPPAGEGIEAGCRVVVLNGRNFPSFQAGDQGRVIRVDKEALNCEVLFDGASQPVPVALRHLRLATAAGSAASNGRVVPELEPRRKSSLSDGSRSRSASPRRSVTIEPVALEAEGSQNPALEQRLRACEAALDSSVQITPRKTPQRRSGIGEDLRNAQPLEERLFQLEQRIKNEVEVLAKQLREAISFGQAQESRANALQRHLQTSGVPMPGSGTIPAAPSSFGSGGPLYLSAALPPRLCATPTRGGAAAAPEECVSCGTQNVPGSNFCMKCGAGQESASQEDQSRRMSLSASASTTASQNSSYIRGSSYLASGPAGPGQSGASQLLQPTTMTPAQPHLLLLPHGHPQHPHGCPHPGLPQGPLVMEECGVSPVHSAHGLAAPQVLTPRLVLPHRPFG